MSSPTVIPTATRFSGTVETPDDLIVEGRCDGVIDIGGKVVVAADAVCKAVIKARIAEIHGEVIGDVTCRESITVATGSRVVGNLRAPDIAVDAGSQVDGKIDLLPPVAEPALIRRLPVTVKSAALKRPIPPPRPTE